MDLISRVTNRMFVGLPLCRNNDFLKHNSSFAIGVIVAIQILQFFPKILHPVVAHIICLPNHYHYWCTRKHTIPLAKQRLADIQTKVSNPDSKLEIPDDYITWHIRLALQEQRPHELKPSTISRCLMPIEFAAIHTTSLTLAMALFDIFSTDCIAAIREECSRVHRECGGIWNKQSLSKLIRTDSAIRESMRVSNFALRSINRKVVAKEGVRMEEEGGRTVFLPYGSRLAVDEQNRHHDADVYPDPDRFDAFRFSRPREEYDAPLAAEGAKSDGYLKMRNLSMISTGENFLAFGHGRHACPGRVGLHPCPSLSACMLSSILCPQFLVQHELKVSLRRLKHCVRVEQVLMPLQMIVAHIVMNYDVERFASRPSNELVAGTVLPPLKTKLRIRTRRDDSQ